MTYLHHVAPELAEKLRCISFSLEQGSLRDVSQSVSDDVKTAMSVERETAHFRRLNDEWLEVLEEVRQLEGFHDFLRPLQLSTLQGAATQTPVVILNASKAGCDALIVTSTGVHHVPLVLTFANVTQLVKLVKHATAPSNRDPLDAEANRAHVEDLLQQMPLLSNTLQLFRQTLERGALTRIAGSDLLFQYVLAMLWESGIKDVIHLLDFKVS